MAESKPTNVPGPLPLQNQDPRSHRYEVDENAAFSPPSSAHMFQIFDSSEIFSKHPRKYDILNSQDDSSVKSSSSSGSTLAVPTKNKSRSKSLAGLGIPSEAEYKKLLSDSGRTDVPSNASLKPKTEEPRRRISVAVMQSHPGSSGSGPPAAGPPRAHTDDDVGGLSKMFRAAFGTGSATQKPPTLGYLPEEDEPAEPTKTHQPDFGSMTSADTGGSPELVPVTITPEPRRLFGFGPQYTPPAETVMVTPDQARKISGGSMAGGSLVDKINLAGITGAAGGITAMDGPAAAPAGGSRQRKMGSIMRPPTGEEMNTWAPFST